MNKQQRRSYCEAKKKEHRAIKRHENQEWRKRFNEIRNWKACGTAKMRALQELEEEFEGIP